MSVAEDIITALSADLTAAISGVTVSTEAVSVDELPSEDFPFAALLQTDYDVEVLDWAQERRVWTITGMIARQGSTREAIQDDLEALQTQIMADPELGSTVERVRFKSSVSHSHPDATRTYGSFVVEAEKVV